MRKSRKRKHQPAKRKLKTVIIISQTFVIVYGSVYSLSILISDTEAKFLKREKSVFNIEAGTWWEESELRIIGTNYEKNVCPPTTITAEIKNVGFSMTGSSTYEVYYSEDGNPKVDGQKIGGGTIEPLKENEVDQISYRVEKEGVYVFKVYQRPGFEIEDLNEIWSEVVVVKCQDENEENNGEKMGNDLDKTTPSNEQQISDHTSQTIDQPSEQNNVDGNVKDVETENGEKEADREESGESSSSEEMKETDITIEEEHEYTDANEDSQEESESKDTTGENDGGTNENG